MIHMPPVKSELLLKVIVWRAVSMLCSFASSLAFTGELGVSVGITVVTGTALTLIHWLFEVMWEGRSKKD